jgi:chromosome segregation ATPase
MGKTLKDLFLALLNATLILVALCLFLSLMLVNRANSLTESFAEHLRTVAPLQESVQEAGAEIAALRADLAALGDQSGEISSATMQRIQDRVEEMEARLETMQASMAELRDAPERLVDHAIEKAGEQATATATRIRGCVPADAEDS